MYAYLKYYLEKHQNLTLNNRYSYRKGKSTVDAIYHIVDKIETEETTYMLVRQLLRCFRPHVLAEALFLLRNLQIATSIRELEEFQSNIWNNKWFETEKSQYTQNISRPLQQKIEEPRFNV